MIWPPEDIWNNPTALATYYTDYAIPLRPQAGILVLSIIVSILGSYATLLLLGRITSKKGLRNYVFLGLAALCFAAVAVWGMHFVSMISVRLRPSPDLSWVLQFSRGMTALSLFVPLIATAFTFWFLGDEDSLVEPEDTWAGSLSPLSLITSWRILLGGIFLGLTIGLMHYSASFQLPYLLVSYSAVTVVFALILACVAATTALALFFRARSQWQDSFWKRGLCSIVLAAAVCGMHYLGLGGTSYRVRPGVDAELLFSGHDQNTRLTIAISVMCGAIILLSLALAYLNIRTRRELAEKKKRIVIASLSFDETGKLLTRPDGTLPMQALREGDNKNNADYDPMSSMYQWLFQLSFCWSSVTPYVGRIVEAAHKRQEGAQIEDDLVRYRTSFIEAVVQLAHSIDLSVDSIGILFDRVLQTGTRTGPVDDHTPAKDEEASIHGITLRMSSTSEGIMCFVVRSIGNGKPSVSDFPDREQPTQAHKESVDWYLQKGWRMADPHHYARVLADTLSVNRLEMDNFLAACKTFSRRGSHQVVQTKGIYLGIFGARPLPEEGNLDVLVYNFARHQIPAYRLPDLQGPLHQKCLDFIKSSGNLTVEEFLEKTNEYMRAVDRSDGSSTAGSTSEDGSVGEDQLYAFIASLSVSIDSLIAACRCWPDLGQIARIHPQVLEVPGSEHDDQPPASIIVLHAILPAPVPGVNGQIARRAWDMPPVPFVYAPWSLFARAQTMVLKGALYSDIAKGYAVQLERLYPRHAVDLAVEVAAQDANYAKGEKSPIEKDSANPFDSPPIGSFGMTTPGSKSKRRPATSHTIRAHGGSDPEKLIEGTELLQMSGGTTTLGSGGGDELTPGSRKTRGRPSTAVESGNVFKGALTSLGLRPKTLMEEGMMNNQVAPDADGPPIYAHVRSKADGWHVRLMRSLEDGERGGELMGTDWASQSRLLPVT